MVTEDVLDFPGYRVRLATKEDIPAVQAAIDNDPYHYGYHVEQFFYTCPGETPWVLEDETGAVVFFFKTQTACRLTIYFAGSDTKEERARNREAMQAGMVWLEARLVQNGFRELIVNSANRALRFLAHGKFGFKRYVDELVRRLPARQ